LMSNMQKKIKEPQVFLDSGFARLTKNFIKREFLRVGKREYY